MEETLKAKHIEIDLEEYELPEETRIARIVNAIKEKKETDGAYNDHTDSHSDGYGIFI